jgi:hypothetical protein
LLELQSMRERLTSTLEIAGHSFAGRGTRGVRAERWSGGSGRGNAVRGKAGRSAQEHNSGEQRSLDCNYYRMRRHRCLASEITGRELPA